MLERVPTARLWLPAGGRDDPAFEVLLAEAEKRGIEVADGPVDQVCLQLVQGLPGGPGEVGQPGDVGAALLQVVARCFS